MNTIRLTRLFLYRNTVLIALILINVACGKSSSNGGAIVTPQPHTPVTNQSFTLTLDAHREPSGPPTNGVSTANAPERVTLPAPTDLIVGSNGSEFFHVALYIGTTSCDYIHDANASSFRMGSGCTTTNSYVDISTNDTITLTISGGLSNPTSVELTLKVMYL